MRTARHALVVAAVIVTAVLVVATSARAARPATSTCTAPPASAGFAPIVAERVSVVSMINDPVNGVPLSEAQVRGFFPIFGPGLTAPTDEENRAARDAVGGIGCYDVDELTQSIASLIPAQYIVAIQAGENLSAKIALFDRKSGHGVHVEVKGTPDNLTDVIAGAIGDLLDQAQPADCAMPKVTPVASTHPLAVVDVRDPGGDPVSAPQRAALFDRVPGAWIPDDATLAPIRASYGGAKCPPLDGRLVSSEPLTPADVLVSVGLVDDREADLLVVMRSTPGMQATTVHAADPASLDVAIAAGVAELVGRFPKPPPPPTPPPTTAPAPKDSGGSAVADKAGREEKDAREFWTTTVSIASVAAGVVAIGVWGYARYEEGDLAHGIDTRGETYRSSPSAANAKSLRDEGDAWTAYHGFDGAVGPIIGAAGVALLLVPFFIGE